MKIKIVFPSWLQSKPKKEKKESPVQESYEGSSFFNIRTLSWLITAIMMGYVTFTIVSSIGNLVQESIYQNTSTTATNSTSYPIEVLSSSMSLFVILAVLLPLGIIAWNFMRFTDPID